MVATAAALSIISLFTFVYAFVLNNLLKVELERDKPKVEQS